MQRLPRWDIFCRVIDNYGDIGVCWRLSRQLAAEHGVSVRLWVDSLSTFAVLCPEINPGEQIQRVGNIEVGLWSADFPDDVETADVVIEAFACELPASYVAAMSRRPIAPVWINLEYLSAEPWVTECHGLASPQSHAGLTKYFFFPGFVEGTGGLIREQGLLAARQALTRDAAVFWRSLHVPVATDGERHVSMFCYDNPALPDLLNVWSTETTVTRLLVMPGPATEQTARWLGTDLSPGTTRQQGALTVQALPFLTQDRYDALLWACDINFVRGEDSFVRAQWAGRPFIWQIYPQAENSHLAKLEAFLSLYLDSLSNPDTVRSCWQAWNGVGRIDDGWRAFAANRQALDTHSKQWASQLDRAQNLANNLVRFAHGVRSQA